MSDAEHSRRTGQDAFLGASPFDRMYGLEVLECSDAIVRGRVAVRPELTQPAGLVHGGVYAAIAETLASIGTNSGVLASGMVGMGLSNHTSFLRPVRTGHVEGTARLRHRSAHAWLWDVELRDERGRLCAVTRMTVAVRPVG